MSTSTPVNFKMVAQRLMFGQQSIKETELIEEFQLEYRSGKNVVDINKSIEKSRKNGHGRSENELSFLELYLSQVFKKNEAKYPVGSTHIDSADQEIYKQGSNADTWASQWDKKNNNWIVSSVWKNAELNSFPRFDCL
jgi:hypothetical protein